MNKKKITFLIAMCGFSAMAQVPSIEWQKTFGSNRTDVAKSIKETSDGGFIVSGSTYSSLVGAHGSNDAWVMKLDVSGSLVWQKCYGGTSDDAAGGIIQTQDGGYIFIASTYSNDGDVTNNHGQADVWVVKIDNIGTIEWEKSYGGSYVDGAGSIIQTVDGGYIFAGSTESSDGDVMNHSAGTAWVVKLDNTGNIEWQSVLGGSSNDAFSSIKQNLDGRFILAGTASSNDGDVLGNHGSDDAWIVLLSQTGSIDMSGCYGGTNIDGAGSVEETLDGGFIFSGTTRSNNGDISGNNGSSDIWVLKLNSAWDIEWQKLFGGGYDDEAANVTQTSDGGFILAGSILSISANPSIGSHFGNDFFIVKLNNLGTVEWQKYLGGGADDMAHHVIETSDGAYVVAGEELSSSGDITVHYGYEDGWVVKLSNNTTGMSESIAENSFQVFPTPTNSNLNISIVVKQNEKYQMQLDNVIGQTVIDKTINLQSGLNNERLDLSNLKEGVYFLKLKNNNTSETRKIVVKH